MITSKECFEKFGNPVQEKSMTILVVPTELQVGKIPKKIYCNKLMVEPLKKALGNLISRNLVGELKSWDGCFAIRTKRGGSSYSLHSWGVAVDLNASENQMGKQPKLSSGFVKCFTDAGFEWGGNWKSPDGMHFELGKL